MVNKPTDAPGFLPRLLRNRLSALRRWFDRRNHLHFLHIRKTGGTAVKHALADHLENEHYTLQLHEHDTRLTDVPIGHGVILFLRDPVTLYVSGFNSRLRQGQPRYNSPWNDGERKAFEKFTSAEALAIALDDEDSSTQDSAREAMKAIRHVNQGYRYWLGSDSYIRLRLSDLFFIGYQETLADDFERLSASLRLSQSVVLPDDDVSAHRNPHPPDVLTTRAQQNIRQWYKEDYAVLECLQEINNLLPATSRRL